MGYNFDIEKALLRVPTVLEDGISVEMCILDAFVFEGASYAVACSSMARNPFNENEAMGQMHVMTYDGDIHEDLITNIRWCEEYVCARVIAHYAAHLDGRSRIAFGDET